MTISEINHALESCIKGNSSYPGLVHSLFSLGCSEDLIKVIIAGALGESKRDRVGPLVAMLTAYQNLSSTEQVDMLYSIVNEQDANIQNDPPRKRSAG
jgi:hypothetical protein